MRHRGRDGCDGNVALSQATGELSHFRAAVGCRGLAQTNPGAERLGDEVRAVEQEQLAALASRRGAKARDDGVLTAGDGGHAGRIALW